MGPPIAALLAPMCVRGHRPPKTCPTARGGALNSRCDRRKWVLAPLPLPPLGSLAAACTARRTMRRTQPIAECHWQRHWADRVGRGRIKKRKKGRGRPGRVCKLVQADSAPAGQPRDTAVRGPLRVLRQCRASRGRTRGCRRGRGALQPCLPPWDCARAHLQDIREGGAPDLDERVLGRVFRRRGGAHAVVARDAAAATIEPLLQAVSPPLPLALASGQAGGARLKEKDARTAVQPRQVGANQLSRGGGRLVGPRHAGGGVDGRFVRHHDGGMDIDGRGGSG